MAKIASIMKTGISRLSYSITKTAAAIARAIQPEREYVNSIAPNGKSIPAQRSSFETFHFFFPSTKDMANGMKSTKNSA